jgi:long-chain acyl-CoA synthetase
MYTALPSIMKKLNKPIRKIPTVRSPHGIKTISEMIESSVDRYGDRTAYLKPRDNDIHRLSYAEILEHVKRIGRYLKDLRIGKGDNIAILGENRPEWGISYFTISWIGGTAVPLDPRGSMESLRFILRYSDAKAIFLSAYYLPNLRPMLEELEGLKHMIIMETFDDIYLKYSRGIEKEDISDHDLLEILFTSGTTGNPKGVMLTHKNVMSNVEDMHKILDCSPDDRSFSVLPLHHSYECTCGLLGTFYNGASVFYARSIKPREMLEDLRAASPTIWFNAPLILEKLYLRIDKEISSTAGLKGIFIRALPKKIVGNRIKKRLGLEKIRLIICGGASLPGWVSKGLERFGFPIVQGYGLSETSPLISVNPPSKPKNDSVGMIIESDEVEIRDVDEDVNGEIVVSGPNIMKGYYKNENATREVLMPDGWLYTGDIGFFDDEGYLYITGRKKFLIVTPGGKNLSPEELEERLTKSSYIEEALVFSPDDRSIQALIYPNYEQARSRLEASGLVASDENVWELIKSEIRRINHNLEAYKRISNFAIKLDEFPKTTTRKIKRHLFKNASIKPEQKVFKT